MRRHQLTFSFVGLICCLCLLTSCTGDSDGTLTPSGARDWTTIGELGGGQVLDLAYDGTNDILYAGTQSSRVFRGRESIPAAVTGEKY